MILCLDVGNSHIHGGVFKEDKILLQFRKTSGFKSSSDELGLFLKFVLRENDIDPSGIEKISICTVVPDILHSLKNACLKYFNQSPFILEAGVKTGLKIKYQNPVEVGTDRIANALACVHLFSQRNLIVVDFGTATTICVINKNKEYLGGSILPGIYISMEVLESKTAKLPTVEIKKPESVIGRSTITSIQSGLYYGHLKMVEGMISEVIREKKWFGMEKPFVVGSGGFSRLFEFQKIFDKIIPDLALRGLYLALTMNLNRTNNKRRDIVFNPDEVKNSQSHRNNGQPQL